MRISIPPHVKAGDYLGGIIVTSTDITNGFIEDDRPSPEEYQKFFPGEPFLVAPNRIAIVCDKCGALVSSHHMTDHIKFHGIEA